jgi:hypothetical protein
LLSYSPYYSAWRRPSRKIKVFYSPIIQVDKEKGFIVVSNSGKVFAVEVPDTAKPHLEKLPLSGMIDIVVEMRPGQCAALKKMEGRRGRVQLQTIRRQNVQVMPFSPTSSVSSFRPLVLTK